MTECARGPILANCDYSIVGSIPTSDVFISISRCHFVCFPNLYVIERNGSFVQGSNSPIVVGEIRRGGIKNTN